MRNQSDFKREIEEAIQQDVRRRREREMKEQRRRRRRRIVALAAVLAALLGPPVVWLGSRFYHEWRCQRVAMQFLKAVEQRDGEALYKLVKPDDLKELNLTPEKAQAFVAGLFEGLGEVKVHSIRKLPVLPNLAVPEGRDWDIYWSDATGAGLPGQYYSGKFRSRISVQPTKAGPRVNFWGFIVGTSISRWGREQGIQAARAIVQTKTR